jgi:hypothetical protein
MMRAEGPGVIRGLARSGPEMKRHRSWGETSDAAAKDTHRSEPVQERGFR